LLLKLLPGQATNVESRQADIVEMEMHLTQSIDRAYRSIYKAIDKARSWILLLQEIQYSRLSSPRGEQKAQMTPFCGL
jgi:hypothetical protein